jgi:hypothetical protein
VLSKFCPEYPLDNDTRKRQQIRNWNRENVTELGERLEVLPIYESGQGNIPEDAPIFGQQIKEMTRKMLS